ALAAGDLLQALLGLALLALELLALGADLLQLLLGEPALLLGLALALALGQVDLLLAAALLLLALRARALGLGVAAHFVLVDRRGLGHALLRRGAAFDQRLLRSGFRQGLRRRGDVLGHRFGQRRQRFGFGQRDRLGAQGLGGGPLVGVGHLQHRLDRR